MLIRLTEEALFAANSGIPFSPEGVKSLMISDNSPKQLTKTRCIGYKGLGFRSVLGWSSSIVVSSGKLTIGFSRNNAVSWLKNIAETTPKITAKLALAESSSLINPVPTLAVPFWLEESMLKERLFEKIASTISTFRKNGFDTVVALKFDDPQNAVTHIQEQLEGLAPESLLFLQHLEELEVQTPKGNFIWRAKRSKDRVTIEFSNGGARAYRIFNDSGSIPTEFRRTEQPLLTEYQITLAVGEQDDRNHRLFTYFPTATLFPFSSVAHATFELTENRQHLIESPVNAWLAGKLARFMVEMAETEATPKNPWSALLSITPKGDVDPILVRLGFENALYEEARSRNLIPVRDGQFRNSRAAKRIRGDFDNLLTGPLFEELGLSESEERLKALLQVLGVEFIQSDDLKNRLNQLSKTPLSLDQRADIIHRMVKNDLVEDDDYPELLLDQNGEVIRSDSKPFLPPEGIQFSLPSWVPQKMLNSELASRLRDRFALKRVRDLAASLSSFDVQEYNFSSVISSIVAEANRRTKNDPDIEGEIRKQMVAAIWKVYTAIDNAERPSVPEDITAFLPARSGKFAPARTLYFGEDYPGGELLEALYSKLGGPFIDGLDRIGIQAALPDVKKFLAWLGVAEQPLEMNVDFTSGEFVEHLLALLQYPAQFGDDVIIQREEVEANYWRLSNVTTIDRLEEVLESADPHAIIAWMIKSRSRLDSWRTSGDRDARLSVRPPGKQLRRESDARMPSHVSWLLSTIEWIPVADGNKRSASRCTFAKGLSKELSSFVGRPVLNEDHPLLRETEADHTLLRNVLSSIGVVTDLDNLSWDSFYDILLELPNKDPIGENARSVYRALIERSDPDNPEGEKYEKFKTLGHMWGRKGNNSSYFQVNDLFYLENQTLPESAARLFPLLDLDYRRGAAKVKRIFGVKPLNPSETDIQIDDFDEHPLSSDFQREVDGLKPYIYALRVEADSKRSELRKIKDLSIKLCKSAKGHLKIGNETVQLILRTSDYLIAGSTAYIVAEPADYAKAFIQDEIIADALGDIFGTLAEVNIGSDVARILTCSSQRLDTLLDRMAGGAGKIRLEKSNTFFADLSTGIEADFRGYAVPPAPVSSPNEVPASSEVPNLQPAPVPTVPVPSQVGPVIVNQGEPIRIPIPRNISQVVQINTRVHTFEIIRRPSLDPDRSESLAMRFESAQGRFPKLVSHLRGNDAYGCDIISFGTEENLKTFDGSLDTRLIERFVEVKGSVNETGGIELKGNELESAGKYRDRFYIYRIFETDVTGTFELVATANPLEVEVAAIKRQFEVNPFKTAKSVRYDVKEMETAEGDERSENLGASIPASTR
jgi:hypothetical protein